MTKRATRSEKQEWWSRPLADALSWLTWEHAAYLALFLVALALRLWGLGDRAMSHDESLHALYSWKLYAGQGYQHDPMMHGPFLFFANALIYYLFGVSDFTARLVPALFGAVLVVLPYFLRKWMGRLPLLSKHEKCQGITLPFSTIPVRRLGGGVPELREQPKDARQYLMQESSSQSFR